MARAPNEILVSVAAGDGGHEPRAPCGSAYVAFIDLAIEECCAIPPEARGNGARTVSRKSRHVTLA